MNRHHTADPAARAAAIAEHDTRGLPPERYFDAWVRVYDDALRELADDSEETPGYPPGYHEADINQY